jgi:hypothetical protein
MTERDAVDEPGDTLGITRGRAVHNPGRIHPNHVTPPHTVTARGDRGDAESASFRPILAFLHNPQHLWTSTP